GARRRCRREVSGPLGDVQVALRDVAQEHVVGGFGLVAGEQALEALTDLLARHLHAVALENLADQIVVRLDGLGHREVAVGAGAAPGPEIERRHVEEHLIRLGGSRRMMSPWKLGSSWYWRTPS